MLARGGDKDDRTHDIVPYISLNDDLLLSRGGFAHTRTRRKLASHHLGRFLQVNAEEIETLDMRLMLSFRPLCSLDDDLCGLRMSEIQQANEVIKYAPPSSWLLARPSSQPFAQP